MNNNWGYSLCVPTTCRVAVHPPHRQAMHDEGGWCSVTSQANSLQGCRLPGWLLAGHSRFPACLQHLTLSQIWLPCHDLIMQASFWWTCATGVEGLVMWQISRSSQAICMLSAGGNPIAEIPSHKVSAALVQCVKLSPFTASVWEGPLTSRLCCSCRRLSLSGHHHRMLQSTSPNL